MAGALYVRCPFVRSDEGVAAVGHMADRPAPLSSGFRVQCVGFSFEGLGYLGSSRMRVPF